MILLHEERTVVITPTKTGASSMMGMARMRKQILSVSQGDVEEMVIAPKHRTLIPKKYRSYRPVILVRNPWDRFTSMYKFIKPRPGQIQNLGVCHLCSQEHFGSRYCGSFMEFIDYFLMRFAHNPDPIWSQNQCQLMDAVSAQGSPVRAVEIGNFISELGWTSQAMHVNKSKPIDETLWTFESVTKMQDWADPDCLRLGYDRLPLGYTSK